jgi:hypothetical protein
MQLLINYQIYIDKNIDTFIDLLKLIFNVVWLKIRSTDIKIVWSISNAFTIKVMLIIKTYDLMIVFELDRVICGQAIYNMHYGRFCCIRYKYTKCS